MSLPVVEIIVIFVLILINGFFAASEIAVVSSRRGRLQQQADEGKKSARQALGLTENPDRFLATVQIGVTLVSTLASAFGGESISSIIATWLSTFPMLRPYASSLALGIVVILIAYFTLVIGELAPKRVGLQSAEKIAMGVAPLMTTLSRIASPIVLLLTSSATGLLRLIGQGNAPKEVVTAEDIVYLAREGTASGTVETEEEEFINRVFRFTDRNVNNVMKPRTEVVAVEVGTPVREVIETFINSGYTRLPLYEDSLDNVVGVLYAKDLLRPRLENVKEEDVDLRALARPPFFISEYQHVDALLTTFRRRGIHLAIVIDEYSQVVGVVTLEDILEELVGEIQDEYDAPDTSEIVQREDGSWLVNAMTEHEKVREKIGMPLHDDDVHEDYHTLAGMILERMGRIPKEGDTVTIDGFTFEVVDMDGRRIDKVLIRREGQAEETAAPA